MLVSFASIYVKTVGNWTLKYMLRKCDQDSHIKNQPKKQRGESKKSKKLHGLSTTIILALSILLFKSHVYDILRGSPGVPLQHFFTIFSQKGSTQFRIL